jgi:hypothetical protein
MAFSVERRELIAGVGTVALALAARRTRAETGDDAGGSRQTTRSTFSPTFDVAEVRWTATST